MATQTRIAIAGSGFAGLEAAFYLRRRLGDEARITVVSDSKQFLFRPNMIYIPFGKEPEGLTFDVSATLEDHGIEWVHQPVTGIDPDARTLITAGGADVEYDYAVLATGADMVPQEVPGLEEHAYTIWTPDSNLALRGALGKAVERARGGERQRVVFAVPPKNMCSGPLYEIVLMLDSWLRDQPAPVRDNITIDFATFEPAYIMVFGPRINAVVEQEFDARGITGHREHGLERVEEGEAVFGDGTRLSYDLLISFPPYEAAVRYESLPGDERGFIDTDMESRRVRGHDRIFAIGDAGDFPVKQAFLALLEADAAADAIACDILGEHPDKAFDPVSLCIMEQFDKATFANVPLQLSGRSVPPVEVREGAEDEYQVGSGRVWRVGKKMLGLAVPMHFRHGRPFHAGMSWKLMEPGLNGMKSLFAD